MKNRIEERYGSWNQRIQNEYQKIFNTEEYVYDGVINPVLYHDTPLKIMFINRESNDPDNCYSLPEVINSQINNGEKILLNSIFRESLQYDVVLANCLLNSDFPNISYTQFSKLCSQLTEHDFTDAIHKSAICNVKKIPGGSQVKWDQMIEHYKKSYHILLKQIQYFNPTIIFGGNIVDKLLDIDIPLIDGISFKWSKEIDKSGERDLIGKNSHIYVCGIEMQNKVYPLIDLYHPSYFKLRNNTEYWYDVLTLIQDLEKEKPGFWNKHIGKDCFFE